MRFVNAVAEGKCKMMKGQRVKEITEDGVITNKGEFVKADTIVTATGLQAGIRKIKSNHNFNVEKDGLWLFRGSIEPGVTNIFFAGHSVAIWMLLTFNVQAIWLTEILRGKVKLPSNKEMEEETIERKTIMRKRMPIPTFVSAHLVSTIPYVDLLLKEMGLKNRRKRNLFSEWFLPYDNSNWLSVITHHV